MDIVGILKSQEERIKAQQGNWGTGNRDRLVNILEENGIHITDNVWDLLLFNIQDLVLNDGKLGIAWRGNESKKVIKVIKENYGLIVDNYKVIMGL